VSFDMRDLPPILPPSAPHALKYASAASRAFGRTGLLMGD